MYTLPSSRKTVLSAEEPVLNGELVCLSKKRIQIHHSTMKLGYTE